MVKEGKNELEMIGSNGGERIEKMIQGFRK